MADEVFLAKLSRGILKLPVLESNIGLDRALLLQMLHAVDRLATLQLLGRPKGRPDGEKATKVRAKVFIDGTDARPHRKKNR